MKDNIIILGIAGGSGSGKSSISRYVADYYGHEKSDIIELDSYYHDLKHLSMPDREKNNFDHPNAIDFDLMNKHLIELINGNEISIPIYDYKNHIRTEDFKKIKANKIIILEGLFALLKKEIRKLITIKVFVETNEETRLKRRIKRDIKYRKRTRSSVIKQYNDTVKPMYDRYIGPTKEHADIIIHKGVKNTVAIEQLIAKINLMDKEGINIK
ncbi:MAG: uridine kinase [Candidatus Marinimicrobia bacterium]|nr:uridine kinase [Candidatus Neomarinimicrobiota bacterium]|tara:strand:+ start:2461 stop:3099 length:639 start_codon:yes stop_codon:yes gene_type:complete